MDRDRFLLRCSLDIGFWSENVFGYKLAPFHKEWINAVQDNPRVAIVAPTGFGKTTALGIVYPLWRIWNTPKFVYLLVSNSMDQSIKLMELIRSEIEDNELLQELVPDDAGITWSKKALTTTNKARIFCKPNNKNVKGVHADYALCDEVASYEDISVFKKFVTTRVNQKHGTLAAISTPESEFDLMMGDLMQNKEYWRKIYTACEIGKDGSLVNPLWPDKFPLSELERIRRESPSTFSTEYLCNPVQMGKQLYPEKDVYACCDNNLGFRDYTDGEFVYMSADIALSSAVFADLSVFTIVEVVGDRYVIRKMVAPERGTPERTQVDMIYNLAQQYKPKLIYLDQSGPGITFLQDLNALHLPVIGCKFDHSSRNDYLINMARVISEHRLVIPTSEDDMACNHMSTELLHQLLSFELKRLESGTQTYVCKSKHDDYAISLSLALKAAAQQRSFLAYIATGDDNPETAPDDEVEYEKGVTYTIKGLNIPSTEKYL